MSFDTITTVAKIPHEVLTIETIFNLAAMILAAGSTGLLTEVSLYREGSRWVMEAVT